MKNEEKEDKCDTIVIAKMYTSLNQLEYDNDKPIYFDKKYDNIIPLTYFSGSNGPDKCKLTNRKFKCKKYAVK